MNFNELKNLAKKLGGILVVNGDNPEFVVLPYDKFEKLQPTGGGWRKTDGYTEDDGAAIEKLNKEILALKEEIRQKEEAELAESERQEQEGVEIAETNEEVTDEGLGG